MALPPLHVSVSWTHAKLVAFALEDLTAEMAAEVLPTPDLIHLEAQELQPTQSVERLVSVRRLSGQPVAVVHTESEFIERLESRITK